MRVETIKTSNNKPNRRIVSFNQEETKRNNRTPNNAILALQNPNALVKFEKDFRISQGADAVQSNPISALGYKLYQTIKIFYGPRLDTRRSFSTTV